MSEQREFFRKTSGFPASFTITGGTKRETTVINFSAGGFCFNSKQDLPPGAVVVLTVQLDEKSSVSLKVRTAWAKKIANTDECLIGVKITDADGPDLVKFLEHYAHVLSKFLTDIKDIK